VATRRALDLNSPSLEEVEKKMSADVPSDSRSEKKKRRAGKSQLRIVLDTNSLYVAPNSIGSASDLVRQEIANVIADARYPDLEILWYLPEIVRHERQYQMQAEALKLRHAINKIERLLGLNLALTDALLLHHVETKIQEKEKQLGLQEIKLDHSSVDWPKLIHSAVYRTPPFEAGEKEKGFRDALVAESFLQLLSSSPKTPSLCRVVLITSDGLLAQAVKERIADSPNASILANVEELKGLINTIVSNVGEEFIGQLKPKASKLFFVSSEDKETVFYRERIRERIKEKFQSELETKPQGTAFRENGTWHIDRPNFSRKEGRRVFWTSRIEIELDAGTVVSENEPQSSLYFPTLQNLYSQPGSQLIAPPQQDPSLTPITFFSQPFTLQNALQKIDSRSLVSEKRVISHKGRDIFEVLWSTEVTMSKELKKPVIEDITHVELSCQPVS
jgi:hypothetical protein